MTVRPVPSLSLRELLKRVIRGKGVEGDLEGHWKNEIPPETGLLEGKVRPDKRGRAGSTGDLDIYPLLAGTRSDREDLVTETEEGLGIQTSNVSV